MCWDKCVGPYSGAVPSGLTSAQETCAVNCTKRFLDTQKEIAQTFAAARAQTVKDA